METYAGDVLEHALNNGVASAAARYGLSEEATAEVVRTFAHEIGDEPRCACELARANGHVILCFACTGPVRQRIAI